MHTIYTPTAHNTHRYLQVALLSARKAAPSLIPYLVFDGAPNEVTAWFERQGGRVILHELTISETLKRVRWRCHHQKLFV